MHQTIEDAKNQRADFCAEEYCRLYSSAFYIIAILYDDNNKKERDVLLSAFQEMVKKAE